MLRVSMFETPIKSYEHNICDSNKSKQNSNNKSIRLLDYHKQRTSSRQKILDNSPGNSPFKKNSGSLSHIRDLHQNIEKIISGLIIKLEDKRRKLLESFEEADLKEAQKLFSSWNQSLQQPQNKMISSDVYQINVQTSQKLQPPTQIRFRAATFSSNPSLNIQNFQLAVPIINSSCASNSKSTNGQSTVQKEFDIKSTSSIQLDNVQQLSPPRLAPIHKSSSLRLSNLRPSPLKIKKII